MANQLDMAEQQILGFHHAKQGHSIEELVESMGLEKHEWEKLKRSGIISYLCSNSLEEIDKYFNL